MKVKNILKVLVVCGVLTMLVGCASYGDIAQKYASNSKVEGIIYGAGIDYKSANEVCSAIHNSDERCTHPEQYKVVSVAAKVGYSDGFTGIIAFAPKNMDVGEQCVTGSSKCTYLKALVERNKLGTVLEVASRPGEDKCHWSGMPRIGGTVCNEYNYDYSKNFNGMPR